MRRSVMVAILTAGCRDGGGGAGAARALRETVRAIDEHLPDAEARMFVAPEQLSRLVVCDAPDASWLTAEHRRAWIGQALERAGEVDHVRLSIVEPLHREAWTVWRAGESIVGRCRARVDIARQQWLLMLDVERGGEHTYPGVGVEVWHWGDEWRLWDDPLY